VNELLQFIWDNVIYWNCLIENTGYSNLVFEMKNSGLSQQAPIAQHTVGQSLALHLIPGVLVGACYFALLPLVHRWAMPSMMSLMLALAFVLIPLEFGYLRYVTRRQGGGSLRNIVTYCVAIPTWQYFVWVPALFLLLGVIFTLGKPVDAFLQGWAFSWMPTLESGLREGYSRRALVTTYAMVAVFGVVLGPVTEELYFRGHLLPRMGYAGKWAPLLHCFLFGLYHIWTPWMLLTRILGMLPLAYAVQRRNLYLSIVVHMLANTVDLIGAIVFIAGMATVK